MEVTVSMESLNANAEEMQRLRDEITALAAHVERLTTLLLELDYTMPVTPHLPMAEIKGEYLERVDVALDEGPTTSLDRLIAEKQAEALETVAAEYRGRMEDPELLCIIDAAILERRASDLRHQAEGGKS